MSKRPWMKLYVSDYRSDTMRLTTVQHGAYLLLIMEYWQEGGLPDDDAELAQIVGMRLAEWRKHRPVLRKFFHDGWRHKRIDAELAAAESAYERRAKAGSKGGKAKRRDEAMLQQCSSNAEATRLRVRTRHPTDVPVEEETAPSEGIGYSASGAGQVVPFDRGGVA